MDNQNTAVSSIVSTIFALCKEARVDKRIRPGPKAEYPDSFIITLLILKNLFGFSSESSFLRYFKKHHGDIFIRLPERSWFNRKAKKLILPQIEIHELLLQKLGVDEIKLRIVDSTPLPVVKLHRAGKCVSFERKTEVNYGYCASKKMYYYGKKLTLLVTPNGIPTSHVLTPANVHDLKALKNNLEKITADIEEKTLIADKGYYDGDLETTLEREYHTELVVPEKKRHRKKNTTEEKRLLKKRSIVETINNQLQDHMNIDETRAKSNDGLVSRIQASILSFTFGIYFNKSLGRPMLALKSILI